MKLDILKAALEHYITSADCSEADRKEVSSALASCVQAAERYVSSDIWSNECYVVTADAFDNLMNIATYDIYGRQRRLHGDNMALHHYMDAVRSGYCLEELTNEQLEFGYEIVAYLWDDNEQQGCHNEDGTFRK